MKPVNRIRARLISIVYIYTFILYYIPKHSDEIENFWAGARRVYYYILIASIVLVSRDCGVIHVYCSSESSSGREGWNEGCSHYIRLVIVENVYNNLPSGCIYIIYTYNDIICKHIVYIYTYIICTLRSSTMHGQ